MSTQPALSTKLTKLLNGDPPASGSPLATIAKDVHLGDRLNDLVDLIATVGGEDLSMITPATDVAGAKLQLAEPTGGGTSKVTMQAPALAANRTITVPDADVDLGGIATLGNEVPVNIIADPGTGGAIPVTKSGECGMTSTGAAQARSLADPTFAGQELTLLHKVDGGSLVITAAHAINQTGNTIMTMADVEDLIILKGVTLAGGLRWRVVANDGTALS